MVKRIPKNQIPEQVAMDDAYSPEFRECYYHYQYGTQDMEQRKIRRGGWDDIIKAYYGK